MVLSPQPQSGVQGSMSMYELGQPASQVSCQVHVAAPARARSGFEMTFKNMLRPDSVQAQGPKQGLD